MTDLASELAQFAKTSNAWPFEEAKKLVARVERTGQKQVLFETGYGPSGLPHIGTFGEVARTTMVRHAFEILTGGKIATRLLAFSDDLDGLRKVPDNIPNKDFVAAHLGKPLTQVPDPFGEYPSFGAHNNARLRAFLDHFGFDYEFASSTEYYQSGRFDEMLLKILARFDTVQAVMIPSLREERASTYCPFLPIHPHTGVVMQVPLEEIDLPGRHDRLARPGDGRAVHDQGHRRPLQAAMEARLGDALVRARRRLRNGRQGPDRFRKALGQHRPRARATPRPKVLITNCSSTRTARRFPSPRAMASPSSNG